MVTLNGKKKNNGKVIESFLLRFLYFERLKKRIANNNSSAFCDVFVTKTANATHVAAYSKYKKQC